jgi:hypothetical protein
MPNGFIPNVSYELCAFGINYPKAFKKDVNKTVDLQDLISFFRTKSISLNNSPCI